MFTRAASRFLSCEPCCCTLGDNPSRQNRVSRYKKIRSHFMAHFMALDLSLIYPTPLKPKPQRQGLPKSMLGLVQLLSTLTRELSRSTIARHQSSSSFIILSPKTSPTSWHAPRTEVAGTCTTTIPLLLSPIAAKTPVSHAAQGPLLLTIGRAALWPQ